MFSKSFDDKRFRFMLALFCKMARRRLKRRDDAMTAQVMIKHKGEREPVFLVLCAPMNNPDEDGMIPDPFEAIAYAADQAGEAFHKELKMATEPKTRKSFMVHKGGKS